MLVIGLVLGYRISNTTTLILSVAGAMAGGFIGHLLARYSLKRRQKLDEQRRAALMREYEADLEALKAKHEAQDAELLDGIGKALLKSTQTIGRKQ